MSAGYTDLRNSPIPIPQGLWDVRYNADHFPGGPGVQGGMAVPTASNTLTQSFATSDS